MVDVNLVISTATYANSLNSSTKIETVRVDKETRPSNKCLQETHLKYRHRWSKRMDIDLW